MCHEVQKQLDPQNRAHRPIIDELQERMADKMNVNFSLFHTMPDAWGIDQLFPVLPLDGLDQVPKCTSTSRCSSRCRMRGGSTSCSRFCRWKGWIKCRNAALCCWILPVTQTVLSTTILMVTVLPRQCLCRSTIRRIRRCSVSLWSAHIRRSSAGYYL